MNKSTNERATMAARTNDHLPTLVASTWTVTALRDSFIKHVASDQSGRELRLFFYAVTLPGWKEVQAAVKRWAKNKPSRKVVAYVGTDHGVTDPEALRLMRTDGVELRLMQTYSGVFHPKLIWLLSPNCSHVWIGSNNLTRDGLLNNVEFAALVRSDGTPATLRRWVKGVHAGSALVTEALLADYEAERRRYSVRKAQLGTFTWSRRKRPVIRKRRSAGTVQASRPSSGKAYARRGDLVVEIMARETGQDGKQIQLPMAAAKAFFGLPERVGASRSITLTPTWHRDERMLKTTIFPNHTVRLVIKELDYGDRPGILLFRKRGPALYAFDIVTRESSPARYAALLATCEEPTRKGSRRWALVRSSIKA